MQSDKPGLLNDRRVPSLRGKWVAVAAFVILAAVPGLGYAVTPCGGAGERACCVFEQIPTCDPGTAEVAGCDASNSGGDCSCGLGFESSSHCVAVTACGGEGERACCIGERIPTCDAGLTEAPGCSGDCLCAGLAGIATGTCVQTTHCGGENERACCIDERIPSCEAGLIEIPWCGGDCLCAGSGSASGTCIRPTPCGGLGQRACCNNERGSNPPCSSGLIEVPGCSGDCFCGAGGGDKSSGMCTAMAPMSEPSTNWTPPATPLSCPLRGYADMHLHMFANLAHGGGVLAGKAYDAVGGVNAAIGQDFGTSVDLVKYNGTELSSPPLCPFYIPDCGDRLFHGDHAGAFDDFTGFGTGDNTTSPLGAPIFSGWPTWHTTTHQQVYYKWLERAWRGGLRLITMHAVTNETLCRLSPHLRGTDCMNSMAAIDKQIAEAKAFQAFLDAQYGGEGNGWFRIVTSPMAARKAIAAGKLAVVLGIEADNLFNCKWEDRLTGVCTEETVNAAVDSYFDQGVRTVFPVHNFDNSFGSPATWQVGIDVGNRAVEGRWWDAEDCPGEGYGFKVGDFGDAFVTRLASLLLFGIFDTAPLHEGDASCNALGLTPLGERLMNKLMSKGMLIDIDHMSNKSIDRTLQLAEQQVPKYPVIASHVLPFDMHIEMIRHERMRTADQLDRIRNVGGMVAMMLKDDVQDGGFPGKHFSVAYENGGVPDDCRHSSKSWAQSYLYLVDRMGGPVALGSDFNGVAGHVGPRFGNDACGADPNGGVGMERSLQYRTSTRLAYPFTIPGFGTFDRQVSGDKTFDYNVDGMAHVGLLPDFVQDLKTIGVPDDKLDPLFGSAEEFIRVWERAAVGHEMTVPAAQCVNSIVEADDTCHADASIAHASLLSTENSEKVSLSQSPAGPYSKGTTTVTLTATSRLSCDSPTSCTGNVTVIDQTAPPIQCPAETRQECAGASTPVAFADPTVGPDNCGAAILRGCTPGSGAGFALGDTEVSCSAVDDSQNSASCAFHVVVEDTTKPLITAPADLPAVECASPAGASPALGVPTVSDACDSSPTVINDAPATFPPRQTVNVTWTATDASHNAQSAVQKVTVVDTIRPVVTCSVASTALTTPWPANHALINVGLVSSASDICDGALPVTVRAYSNEDDETPTSKKDAVFSPDAKNIAPGTLQLRQERVDTGTGRVYLIVSTGTDASGNVGSNCCTAVVPHDNNASSLAAVQSEAALARNACIVAGGAPPAGYFRVGDGRVAGPKQ